MSTSKFQKGLFNALGGGIATADVEVQMPSKSDPRPPAEAHPSEPSALDVETFEKVNKLNFLGQDESDPSYLVFEDSNKVRCKLPQAMFHSGFRGKNQGKSY